MQRLPSPCLPFTIFPCFYLPASLSSFYLLSTLTFQLVLEFEQTHMMFYQIFLIKLNYGNLFEIDISRVVVLQNSKRERRENLTFKLQQKVGRSKKIWVSCHIRSLTCYVAACRSLEIKYLKMKRVFSKIFQLRYIILSCITTSYINNVIY